MTTSAADGQSLVGMSGRSKDESPYMWGKKEVLTGRFVELCGVQV